MVRCGLITKKIDMKKPELIKQLANRINQPHVIESWINKIEKAAYNKGYKDAEDYKCSSCNGTGENWQHPKAKSLYKNWKSYDPPKGEGFQLWTTTSEGSPMTPVFDSLQKLCEFCETEKVSVFGRNTATKEEWMRMLDDGFVYHKEGNLIFV